jgi:hypothetical protein
MNAVFTEVAQKLMPGIHRASQPSKAPQKGGWRCNEPFPTTRTSASSTLQGGWQLQYTTITQTTQKGEQSDEPETDETPAETTYCLSSGVRRRDG